MREDLRNDITLLEPEETPYTSLVNKTSQAAAMFTEVQGDRLRAPRTTGFREGNPTGGGGNREVRRGRFGVYQHFTQDEWSVTHHQQIISERGGIAGVANAADRDMAQTEAAVKRDIEAVNCSALETQDGQGGGAAMQTRGGFKWLTPQGTALSPEVPNDFRVPAAAILAHGNAGGILFTEDNLADLIKDGLKPVHGGKRRYTVIGGNNVVNTIDHFSRIVSSSVVANPAQAQHYTVRQGADELTLRLMVNIYETSFGTLEMMSTEFNQISATGVGDPNSALVLFLELWELDMLEDLNEAEHWERATGEGGIVQCTWANRCLSPRGNAKIIQ